MFSHKSIYDAPSAKSIRQSQANNDVESSTISALHENGTTTQKPFETQAAAQEDDEEEEEDVLGFNNALIWLAIITALIAVLSEAISDSIQDAANDAGVSGIFLAAILLPIVGNAAEHAGKQKLSLFSLLLCY